MLCETDSAIFAVPGRHAARLGPPKGADRGAALHRDNPQPLKT